jgi:ribonuclease HI
MEQTSKGYCEERCPHMAPSQTNLHRICRGLGKYLQIKKALGQTRVIRHKDCPTRSAMGAKPAPNLTDCPHDCRYMDTTNPTYGRCGKIGKNLVYKRTSEGMATLRHPACNGMGATERIEAEGSATGDGAPDQAAPETPTSASMCALDDDSPVRVLITDGSYRCTGSNAGGWAWVLLDKRGNLVMEGAGRTSNGVSAQAMEMKSVVEGLESLPARARVLVMNDCEQTVALVNKLLQTENGTYESFTSKNHPFPNLFERLKAKAKHLNITAERINKAVRSEWHIKVHKVSMEMSSME